MKNLLNLLICALMLFASVSIIGCQDRDKNFHKEGHFRDFYLSVSFSGGERTVFLSSDSLGKEYFIAKDYNEDSRFDRIDLFNLPKGHPLEAYVSLDSLEMAYKYMIHAQAYITKDFGDVSMVFIIPDSAGCGFKFYRDSDQDGCFDSYGGGFYMLGLSRRFQENPLPDSTYALEDFKKKYPVE